MQNHLLQILALFAMEPPTTMAAEDIRNEKASNLPPHSDGAGLCFPPTF